MRRGFRSSRATTAPVSCIADAQARGDVFFDMNPAMNVFTDAAKTIMPTVNGQSVHTLDTIEGDFTQPTIGKRASWVQTATPSGHPALDFDGIDDNYDGVGNGLPLMHGYRPSVFFVFNRQAAAVMAFLAGRSNFAEPFTSRFLTANRMEFDVQTNAGGFTGQGTSACDATLANTNTWFVVSNWWGTIPIVNPLTGTGTASTRTVSYVNMTPCQARNDAIGLTQNGVLARTRPYVIGATPISTTGRAQYFNGMIARMFMVHNIEHPEFECIRDELIALYGI